MKGIHHNNLNITMLKNSLQKILFYLFIVVLIFFLDRFSKIYIINLAELNNSTESQRPLSIGS